jgi:hypothetical protein
MAAKKAPMRMTMAKPATRKTAPKNTSSAVRKANAAKKVAAKKPASAADFRKKEEADKKKMSSSAGSAAGKTVGKAVKKQGSLGAKIQRMAKDTSGEAYLKPQSFAQGAYDKRVTKNNSRGDLGSERAVMRQARQRNAKGAKQVEKYGWGVLNATYRDKDGKLKNTTMNAANNAKVPKSGYIFLPKSKKK